MSLNNNVMTVKELVDKLDQQRFNVKFFKVVADVAGQGSIGVTGIVLDKENKLVHFTLDHQDTDDGLTEEKEEIQ